MKTIELTSASFQQVLETSSLPVLVDFHAEWCGPCRMMGPVVDQIATEQQGKVTVAKLNIDDAPEIASRFGITSIPTLIVFKNGQPVASSRGAQSKTTIEKLIHQAA
jgi:thioredoxin 1